MRGEGAEALDVVSEGFLLLFTDIVGESRKGVHRQVVANKFVIRQKTLRHLMVTVPFRGRDCEI